MTHLSIRIDYDKHEVNWEGEINPETAYYLKGMLKWIKDHESTMELSRELGNVPIEAEKTTRIELDEDEPDTSTED